MNQITIRLDLTLSRRGLWLGMIAAMLTSVAPELASESVTLTTYYPAPSGVYTNMIVTGNTFLARDGGSVGIGTSAPAAPLHVKTAGGTVAIVEAAASNDASWQFWEGGVVKAGTVWRNSGAQSALELINYQAGPVNVYTSSLIRMSVNAAGNVGINTTTPTQKLDVNGAMTTVDMLVSSPNCVEAAYSIYGVFQCPANQYISLTSGVMANLTAMPLYQNLGGGLAPVLCCICPTGGCPLWP